MGADQKQWLMDFYGYHNDQWMEYNHYINNTSNHYFSHQDPYGTGIVTTHSSHNHQQYPSSVQPSQLPSQHNLQEIDDVEVEIISKAAFDQAKMNAKSNNGTPQHGGRSRMDIQLGGLGLAAGGGALNNGGVLLTEGEEAAAYRCPICMDKIMEATTTKCGHIFCQGCLRRALAVKKQCPTCRRKLRANSNMKVFLPEIF